MKRTKGQYHPLLFDLGDEGYQFPLALPGFSMLPLDQKTRELLGIYEDVEEHYPQLTEAFLRELIMFFGGNVVATSLIQVAAHLPCRLPAGLPDSCLAACLH